jgi:predicted nucleic acid-binding protein
VNWLLDTNTVVHAINGVASVHRRLNELRGDDRIVTSILVRAELMYGAFRSARREDNVRQISDKLARFEVFPVSEMVADRFGELKAHLRRVGKPRSDVDLLIAATAIEHDCILVTDDHALLDGTVPMLRAENWLDR